MSRRSTPAPAGRSSRLGALGSGARRRLSLALGHHQRHGAPGELGEARAVTLLEVADHLRPHARLPVALEVIGHGPRRFRRLRGAGKKLADLVGHLDEQIDVHVPARFWSVSRCGCAYTTCWSARANATSVSPARCARRTSKAAGSDRATKHEIPATAPYHPNSTAV